MDHRSHTVLAVWLVSKLSLQEVDAIDPYGLVENRRFDPRIKDWYRFLWAWGAYRFSGPAGYRQEKHWRWAGRAGLDRRIRRIRKLADRIAGCPLQWDRLATDHL